MCKILMTEVNSHPHLSDVILNSNLITAACKFEVSSYTLIYSVIRKTCKFNFCTLVQNVYTFYNRVIIEDNTDDTLCNEIKSIPC